MRRHLPLLLCCALLLSLSAPAAADARCRHASARPGTVSDARHARAVRCLINAYRSDARARGVRAEPHLGTAARRHTASMVRRGYFGHAGAGGSSPRQRAARAGYPRRGTWSIAEVIVRGTGRLATPRALVRAWLRSGAHRRIVLSPRWRDVGVGVVIRRGLVTATADFARR